MFERFTERARQVVVLSQEAAREDKRSHIETVHLLVGLVREEEGLAARILDGFGVTNERVIEAIGRLGREDDPNPALTGQVPFTPVAKKTLEASLREALSLGHNYIGTEHILLAMTRNGGDPAASLLDGFGATPERVRAEVVRCLSGPPERPRGAILPTAARTFAAFLDAVCYSNEGKPASALMSVTIGEWHGQIPLGELFALRKKLTEAA